MNSAATALFSLEAEESTTDLLFLEESSLEFVGGGTITNTL